MTRDGTLFCGDGGDEGQVAHAPDGRWIYLFRPEMTREQDGLDDQASCGRAYFGPSGW